MKRTGGSDPKLHLGTKLGRPKDQPKITAMNDLRKGKDPKLHLGTTREAPACNLKSHARM
eukprot:10968804-Karenia_brevis.AAC.1